MIDYDATAGVHKRYKLGSIPRSGQHILITGRLFKSSTPTNPQGWREVVGFLFDKHDSRIIIRVSHTQGKTMPANNVNVEALRIVTNAAKLKMSDLKKQYDELEDEGESLYYTKKDVDLLDTSIFMMEQHIERFDNE